ncbi:hypothetical protein HELRODRAFT_110334 [Helobdella robusta]|uniref:Peroxisomal ATPase PEX1 n=1 Tax=Helobdella robusta TaxID=6412 RepID=T1EF16_HELRO|nr:hypothetical protein HELRODRAFT_110334 [Helobdella robusta]ESO08092.1 hypothetical protein HELRODRAFT_110334 [Helobdella robusta]
MIHSKLIESSNGTDLTLTDEDVYKTISTYKPLHLRFTQLFEPPVISWSDVGGLQRIKKSLTESILWPTTYSKLFKNYPLPLRTGVLLYGPQGTGKTLLASAVASECKLNIISVKGPELLNKFIGASEKAVRDTFKKAKNASPCVIFFDELDSLAPRRGRDSTGVTDRVVNQLLAELDGVEELEGVYVLAATNRPDLIDPALLRPGRLDKLLYFPLPDAAERLMILEALTKNVVLDADVDLKNLADSTENFTGADLKGLLYNALLEVVHHHCHHEEGNNNGEGAFDDSVIKVKYVHLKTALNKTQPSILERDRRRFDEIYSQFNGPNEEIAHNLANTVGVKATFA